ncbi:Telomere resolvase domain protein (plasmid) [Candidatus Trichorickettsia mobilis]|uniref:Telomere resolvase domain protein n=1 Tax=Candidatus Trichorickettsia mobilis TaxID=1346319 RepID=A0ABZ0UU36_9RICK|nr:protelomerase family protein [Candidatus Trichorickettsia mobilis]WPY01547.1 Telomere resolvase domain protein [Candidatus Trichorickettsia mobilis]
MGIAKPQEFFNSIDNVKSLSTLKKKMNAERSYLENQYNTVASLKNGFTTYRNYLKANISTDRLIGKKPLINLLLEQFRLTEEQQAIFNSNKREDIKSNKSELRAIYNVDNYLNTANELLNSEYYLDKIIALCALTGRRAAEIGSTANFEYLNDDEVVFTGQLKTKTREDVQPYNIPLLSDSKAIIETLKAIRELRPRYVNKPELFHSATSKDLSVKVKKHFDGLFEGTPRIKDLRAIYALICFTEFHKIPANKKVDRDVYFSKILGHSESDITTCGSYVDFYIQ